MEIVKPDSPRWEEFIDRLAGPEACDFKEDDTWKCKGGHNRDMAKRILEDMGDVDLIETMSYFSANGGHCDCEIVFNVE